MHLASSPPFPSVAQQPTFVVRTQFSSTPTFPESSKTQLNGRATKINVNKLINVLLVLQYKHSKQGDGFFVCLVRMRCKYQCLIVYFSEDYISKNAWMFFFGIYMDRNLKHFQISSNLKKHVISILVILYHDIIIIVLSYIMYLCCAPKIKLLIINHQQRLK